ncbi:hypothetical protein VP01_462g3 [Puccinia sorghi]|uniref:SCP domain-containing protein n=1 Tax=Puccinia sorghi TaxID=27349 RepID=A0A0L6UND9_9BASI|nr:hypothetical protein VP01_462g3 [Puccinia sorghi]
MGISNVITIMILSSISLAPDQVANLSIPGAPQDNPPQPGPPKYSWEQSWHSETNNQVTTVTTSTSGTIPPNSGFGHGASNAWSYQYSYSSSSDDSQDSATSSGNLSSSFQNTSSDIAHVPSFSSAAGSSYPNRVVDSSTTPMRKVEVSSSPKPTVDAQGRHKDASPTSQSKHRNTKSPGLPRSSASNAAGDTASKSVSPSTHSRYQGVKPSRLPFSNTIDNGNRTSPDTTEGKEHPLYSPVLPGRIATANHTRAREKSDSSATGLFQDWLDAHNNYRSQYGVESLTWSEDLVEVASSQADKCIWKHTSHNEYGENIAAGQNSASDVVTAWVEGPNERDAWNPESATPTHFTQVVWKETKQIGCAFKTCETIAGTSLPQSPVKLWACEYHPKGNIGGEYVKNVLAAAGGRPLAAAATAAFASVDPDDPSRAKAGSGGVTSTTFLPAPE